MTSKKQLVANRRNARKSTGPRTAKGKAKSGKNAIKHGLLSQYVVIYDENQAEFDACRDRFWGQLDPVGELEIMLAERIVGAFSRLRRADRIEAGLFEEMFNRKRDSDANRARVLEKLSGEPVGEPVGEPTFAESVSFDFVSANTLSKFWRYQSHIERSMYRALHELQRLQAARRGEKVAAPTAIDIAVSGVSEP